MTAFNNSRQDCRDPDQNAGRAVAGARLKRIRARMLGKPTGEPGGGTLQLAKLLGIEKREDGRLKPDDSPINAWESGRRSVPERFRSKLVEVLSTVGCTKAGQLLLAAMYPECFSDSEFRTLLHIGQDSRSPAEQWRCMLVDAWCQIADEIRGELEESGRFTEDWEDHVDWKAYEAEAEVLARYEWDRACDYGDAWAAENACRVESSNRIMERLAG